MFLQIYNWFITWEAYIYLYIYNYDIFFFMISKISW